MRQLEGGAKQTFRAPFSYIGFRDIDHAQIGIARSRDGVSNWERHPENPIIRPGRGTFGHDACYKPFAVFDGPRWLLRYNGRRGSLKQIGPAVHEGEDLGYGRKALRFYHTPCW